MELVDSADYYIGKNNYVMAESAIVNALRAEPANFNNSLLLSNLATIQRMQGRYKEAVNNYTLALTKTPNAVTILLNRGKLYFEIDSVNLAKWDFNKILELEPRNIEARYHRILIEIKENQLSDAKKDLDDLKVIAPKSIEASDAEAQLQQARGKYADAILIYTSLIKNEKRIEWLVNRAECYVERQNYNAALEDLADAIELDPQDGYLYLLKAKIKKYQFESAEVESLINKAINCGISSNDANNFLAR